MWYIATYCCSPISDCLWVFYLRGYKGHGSYMLYVFIRRTKHSVKFSSARLKDTSKVLGWDRTRDPRRAKHSAMTVGPRTPGPLILQLPSFLCSGFCFKPISASLETLIFFFLLFYCKTEDNWRLLIRNLSKISAISCELRCLLGLLRSSFG